MRLCIYRNAECYPYQALKVTRGINQDSKKPGHLDFFAMVTLQRIPYSISVRAPPAIEVLMQHYLWVVLLYVEKLSLAVETFQ